MDDDDKKHPMLILSADANRAALVITESGSLVLDDRIKYIWLGLDIETNHVSLNLNKNLITTKIIEP